MITKKNKFQIEAEYNLGRAYGIAKREPPPEQESYTRDWVIGYLDGFRKRVVRETSMMFDRHS